ncbi:MAG: hypothetical protein ACRBBR_05065 [Cellvibrionaceae bacterium]
MGQYKNKSIRWILVAFFLSIFSSFLSAQPDDLAITIDASQYSSTDIELKKALIYTALHYQWEIVEHDKNSMLWKYKRNLLKIDISAPTIKIYNDEDVEIGTKWLARIKKLTLRRLAYYSEVRKAQSFVN